LLSASLLALVPWMQISKAVSSDVSVSLSALGAVVASGVAIHIASLAFNMTAVRVLGIGGKDRAVCESSLLLNPRVMHIDALWRPGPPFKSLSDFWYGGMATALVQLSRSYWISFEVLELCNGVKHGMHPLCAQIESF